MPASMRDQLLAVAKARVYFGHQSVGANILAGLADLARRERVELVVGPRRSASSAGPGILDDLLGENERPLSKIEAFEQAVDGGVGGTVDLAFFKFCYVDFHAKSGVDAIFDRYEQAMARLAERHPKTKFAHVTVPLTVTQQGVKGTVKALLGRPRWGESENEVRHRYNERLRRAHAHPGSLFDLARFEATYADGSLASFSYDGRDIPRLVAAYSDDGQHLNEAGRLHIAAKLASFIAEALAADPRASTC